MNTILILIGLGVLLSCQTPDEQHNKVAQSDLATNATTPADQTAATFYVHAAKGLVLRQTPSSEGTKVLTLEYGSVVTVSSLKATGTAYVAEKVGPYQLKGAWLKVKTKAGKEGYVFERYVYPFPVKANDYGEQSYFEWFYQKLSPQAKVEMTSDDLSAIQEGAMEGRLTVFDDGGEYEFAMFEGGVSEYLRIPAGKMKIEEALVIFRASQFGPTEKTSTRYDEEQKSIYVTGEIAALQIRLVDGFIEVAIHVT